MALLRPEADQPRLAELLACLSLATDLGRGRPDEEALRACLLATRLAKRMGLPDGDLTECYYTALLRFVGCTANAHELTAMAGGDQVSVNGVGDMMDLANPREALTLLLLAGKGLKPLQRPQLLLTALIKGARSAEEGIRSDCEVAARMAHRFGLGDRVEAALYQGFERWDGKGSPRHLRGEAIAFPARVANVAFAAVMFDGAGGEAAAVAAVRRWSGRKLDPAICELFLGDAGAFLSALNAGDPWVSVLAEEPEPRHRISESRLDDVADAFADFADLKSIYLAGHSRGVAALAERAALILGLPAAEVVKVRRAGLMHDIGRVAVSTRVWEKAGTLTTSEWESVRLHPYHTQRILSRSPLLASLSTCAAAHHERLDGSGYHRGLPASMISRPDRVLAAADVYQALTEDRPHRNRMPPGQAAATLKTLRLDPEAVAAVVQAASGEKQSAGRATWPGGLTDREVEVLRLLARGASLKQVGKVLSISPSTVHTHEAHIYEKLGISTRAAAALIAMELGLL